MQKLTDKSVERSAIYEDGETSAYKSEYYSLGSKALSKSVAHSTKDHDKSNLYSKPGEIENVNLLIKGNSMCLKPNLMEHHDYIALP